MPMPPPPTTIVRAGSRVLTCSHRHSPEVHWWWLGREVEVWKLTDGLPSFRTQWVCLCEACHGERRKGRSLQALATADFVLDQDVMHVMPARATFTT